MRPAFVSNIVDVWRPEAILKSPRSHSNKVVQSTQTVLVGSGTVRGRSDSMSIPQLVNLAAASGAMMRSYRAKPPVPCKRCMLKAMIAEQADTGGSSEGPVRQVKNGYGPGVTTQFWPASRLRIPLQKGNRKHLLPIPKLQPMM
jgi:hypothetical protein